MLTKGVFDDKDIEYMGLADDFFRISVFAANLKISPIIKKDSNGNNKVEISYDFYDLFDLMTYQVLLILVNGENKIGLCPYCNTFFVSNRKKTFCTSSHANLMSRNRRVIEKRICNQCGVVFQPTHRKQEYCSLRCKKRSQYLRAKMKGVKEE
jgi:hypothetical protein